MLFRSEAVMTLRDSSLRKSHQRMKRDAREFPLAYHGGGSEIRRVASALSSGQAEQLSSVLFALRLLIKSRGQERR